LQEDLDILFDLGLIFDIIFFKTELADREDHLGNFGEVLFRVVEVIAVKGNG